MSWQKQHNGPLFSDLLWSKPENKMQAGKLLIIGGQAGEFANVAEAYQAATQGGAGHIKVLLPESLIKLTGSLPDVEYAAANKSGSFAAQSLDAFIKLSQWSDHVLLAGDLGKNAETQVLIDKYLQKVTAHITLNYLVRESIGPQQFFGHVSYLKNLVISFNQLQEMGKQYKLTQGITSTMAAAELAETLSQLTRDKQICISGYFNELIWTSAQGKVVSTKIREPLNNTELAAYTATWLMQHPLQPEKALASAVYELSK